MKIPKDILVIEVNKLNFIEKDEIEIKNLKDFIKLCRHFSFRETFKYKDYYYLIGTAVIYFCKTTE